VRLKRVIRVVLWGVKGVLLAVCLGALVAWPLTYRQGRTIAYCRLRADVDPARYCSFQVGCFGGVAGVWYGTGQVSVRPEGGRRMGPLATLAPHRRLAILSGVAIAAVGNAGAARMDLRWVRGRSRSPGCRRSAI
jgi:hypothetical protein